MGPADFVASTLRVNKRTAELLTTGTMALAFAALVVGWGVDINTLTYLACVIVGFAVFIVAVTGFPPRLRLTLSWAFGILLLVWFTCFLVSGLLPGLTPLPPAPCIVQLWKPCIVVQDQVATNQANAADIPTLAPSQVAPVSPPDWGLKTRPADYQVVIQFAGVMRREDVVALAKGLVKSGWRIADADQGGERTEGAAGLNEIRYRSPADRVAANSLAVQIGETKLTSVAPRSVENENVGERTLEVWVSR